MRFVAGFASAILLLVIGGLMVIYSGAYNVAATKPHGPIGRWILQTTMHRSVDARAQTIRIPKKFTDHEVQAGFRAYNEMCVVCHGAPGKEQGEIGKGLRPQPPDLAESATHWNANELFWIVKHGIRMSGMPAFGATHDDRQLWQLVAFLKQLPNVTAERYAEMEHQTKPKGHSH